jgi:hypothetical protein
MSYNPNDHTMTARQVLAGWIVCLGIIGLALAVTSGRQAIPVANADDPQYAGAAAERCPLSGVRLPSFAACATSEAGRTKLAQGHMSPLTAHCS